MQVHLPRSAACKRRLCLCDVITLEVFIIHAKSITWNNDQCEIYLDHLAATLMVKENQSGKVKIIMNFHKPVYIRENSIYYKGVETKARDFELLEPNQKDNCPLKLFNRRILSDCDSKTCYTCSLDDKCIWKNSKCVAYSGTATSWFGKIMKCPETSTNPNSCPNPLDEITDDYERKVILPTEGITLNDFCQWTIKNPDKRVLKVKIMKATDRKSVV